MALVQFYGTGRRKNAVARVYLRPGEGKFTVNGKDVADYFGRKTLEIIARQPLDATGTSTRFDIMAKVIGGGVSGQAGAVKHGIARALLQADANMRPVLKKSGFLTRDPRKKERVKYGLRKARRAPQYSKR